MKQLRQSQRGVSLIEALVAFAIMAFGMLAVVGMQSTLRSNGDVARQRSEALRIAQDYMEEWRGFSSYVTTIDRAAYADIIAVTETSLIGTNATYKLTRRVRSDPAVAGTVTPQRLTAVVDVAWVDRANQAQLVRLSSAVAGVEPELAGSVVLGANPDPILQPQGRFRGIPAAAVRLPSGSGYVPPGQIGSTRVAWVFNNTTGVIKVCTTDATSSAGLLATGVTLSCDATSTSLLLSGFVRFNSSGPFPDVQPYVNQTGSASFVTARRDCFYDARVGTQMEFFCALPISSAESSAWSGTVLFGPNPNPFRILLTDTAGAPDYKVCRYVTAASYTSVTTTLLNQNFLVYDGATACPTGTSQHQPR